MTFSLIIHDPGRDEIGVAVCTNFLAGGAAVLWALPGIGAVATQAFTDPLHGRRGLEHMERLDAEQALGASLAEDREPKLRQVIMASCRGGQAAHTGESCLPYAGHRIGEGVVAAGNMLGSADVPEAMVEAAISSEGEVSGRLLAALEAGHQAGGDVRGAQSAALKVVRASVPDPGTWGTIVDLRVDDSHDPLRALRRLLDLSGTYRGIKGLFAELLESEEELRGRRAPDPVSVPGDHRTADQEATFWFGVSLARRGDIVGAGEVLSDLLAAESSRRRLLAALVEAGLLNPTVANGILAEAVDERS